MGAFKSIKEGSFAAPQIGKTYLMASCRSVLGLRDKSLAAQDNAPFLNM